jgi:hypothetical protein
MYIIGLHLGKNTDKILEGIEKIYSDKKNDNNKYIFKKFDPIIKFDKILIALTDHNVNIIDQYIKNNNIVMVERYDGIKSIQNRKIFNEIIKNININNNIFNCPTFTKYNIHQNNNISKAIIKPHDALNINIAHNVFLIDNINKLNNSFINYDYIIQPFLYHNEIVYKIYYINSKIYITHRYSHNGIINNNNGIEYFGRISDKQNNNKIKKVYITNPQYKDLQLLGDIITKLFGIYFFGIDLIKNIEDGKYYIIDINQCPSFHGIDDIHIILHDEIIKLLN